MLAICDARYCCAIFDQYGRGVFTASKMREKFEYNECNVLRPSNRVHNKSLMIGDLCISVQFFSIEDAVFGLLITLLYVQKIHNLFVAFNNNVQTALLLAISF